MRKFFKYFFATLLLAAPIVIMWQRQAVYDWWVLRTYTPPAEVVALADKTTMTQDARRIFYITKPVLEPQKDAFRQACQSAEKTIVLGCFKTPASIFVYDVNDERLSGIHEVTAAHEMLHAAYERLSVKERSRVDYLTAQTYTALSDERIKKNIDSYRERDASVVPNELHSILGTEVASLPPDLETYYAQYFSKRADVVALSQGYEAEFSSREAQVSGYDSQLKAIKVDIDNLNKTLESQDAQITSQKNTMDAYKASGAAAQYNALVPSYNTLVRNYNSNISLLKSKVSLYNSLVKERNAVVSEEQELLQAIDTRIPNTK